MENDTGCPERARNCGAGSETSARIVRFSLPVYRREHAQTWRMQALSGRTEQRLQWIALRRRALAALRRRGAYLHDGRSATHQRGAEG